MGLDTPVVFLVFNRPDATGRVFERIRIARPGKLFVVADGPRPDREGEGALCDEVRHIASKVDWHCEVFTNYSDENMGCRKRVISGLDWVFSQVEEAIILEDDCLPDPTFFAFCNELLERYRDDERIMHIGANASRYDGSLPLYSYYFSRYPHIWGWATWKRAWSLYDKDMSAWSEVRDSGLLDSMFCDDRARKYRFEIFDMAYRGEIDAWSPAWVFACWLHSGLAVLPKVSLVANIGFGEGATHTGGENRTTARKAVSLDLPLDHPPYILRDSKADYVTEMNVFREQPLHGMVKKIKVMLGG